MQKRFALIFSIMFAWVNAVNSNLLFLQPVLKQREKNKEKHESEVAPVTKLECNTKKPVEVDEIEIMPSSDCEGIPAYKMAFLTA